MTSTLQQEASRKLRFSAQTTMRLAQRLYENGYITYMRTDSTTLSESALTAAREQVDVALRRRLRPARAAPLRAEGEERAGGARGDPPLGRPLPHAAGRALASSPRDEHALYELIWMRTIASQMKDAQGQTVSLRIAADVDRRRGGRVRRLRHGDHVPRLPRRVRGGPRRRPRGAGGRRGAPPAEPRRGRLASSCASSSRRATRRTRRRATPRRRSCARSRSSASAGPSTYASILGTILDRGYVFKRGTALVPVVPRLLGRRPARAALRPARRLRLHRLDGGRPRPDRVGRRAARRLARPLLLRRRRPAACTSSSRTSARSTRARSTRSRSATGSSSASAATGRTSSGTGSARASPRSSRPTS